ncbi:N-acetyltransferase [Flavobacterium arcticum]|uniref:N-acetyltransferase n=1 Tax=Flavobacterium arcticum TaxID=1784713 RepID=A0A345H9Y9_9FLAO|nr:GNAT family N-acetyltransferase [Flavobacterium arcticum]AXG73399.1 N-acetyltransferase [Flavobacterium arcticum]KAF2513186.1 N-acetyltransferase [Flavobacterium arcticum]
MSNKSEAIFSINEAQNQFELEIGEHTVFLEYYMEGDKMLMTHTEAPQELRGTGAASNLVNQALQYAKNNSLVVVPLCSYVADYINKHPEWNTILSEGYQM